jgi:hypothetical protein
LPHPASASAATDAQVIHRWLRIVGQLLISCSESSSFCATILVV